MRTGTISHDRARKMRAEVTRDLQNRGWWHEAEETSSRAGVKAGVKASAGYQAIGDVEAEGGMGEGRRRRPTGRRDL